jgi:hypothetical protein
MTFTLVNPLGVPLPRKGESRPRQSATLLNPRAALLPSLTGAPARRCATKVNHAGNPSAASGDKRRDASSRQAPLPNQPKKKQEPENKSQPTASRARAKQAMSTGRTDYPSLNEGSRF